MYRLMLVEDEKLVRDSMIENTEWEALGYELVCACSDGREAIERMNQVMPDVVITDICMPLVDGIELAGYIRTYFPQVLVVMLTGYGEFEYAQSALKLHVFDYVLKPILPKQFNALLTQIARELERRRTQEGEAPVYDGKLTHTLHENMFRWIVRGDADEEQISAVAARTGFSLEGQARCVMMVTQASCSGMEPQERMRQLRMLSEQITALEPQYENAIVDHYCIMLIFGGDTPEAAIENGRRFAHRILLGTAEIAPVCIGIGDAVCGQSRLHTSANQALHALGYDFCLQKSILVDREEREAEKHIPYKKMREYETAVTDALQWKDYDGAREAVRAWSYAMVIHHVHQEHVLPSLKRMETSVRDFLAQRDLLREDLWQEQEEKHHILQAQRDLLQRIDCVADLMEQPGDSGEQYVERAEAYIRERYMDYQFSQSELLEHLGVSKSYFCALFKAEKGVSFTEYLVSLRIEEAKKLLRTTNMYTSEIATRIGFLDANYFSMTFKRLVGVTPRQYRKENP